MPITFFFQPKTRNDLVADTVTCHTTIVSSLPAVVSFVGLGNYLWLWPLLSKLLNDENNPVNNNFSPIVYLMVTGAGMSIINSLPFWLNLRQSEAVDHRERMGEETFATLVRNLDRKTLASHVFLGLLSTASSFLSGASLGYFAMNVFCWLTVPSEQSDIEENLQGSLVFMLCFCYVQFLMMAMNLSGYKLVNHPAIGDDDVAAVDPNYFSEVDAFSNETLLSIEVDDDEHNNWGDDYTVFLGM